MANMLPSSSYDAFYVQHAGGADPTVSGRAHSPNGYRSYPASMVSGGPSDVAHALPHHHQQQHHAQPVAAHSHNGHLFSHHANFGTQQSWPMSHTSSASTSKEPFASSLNHSPWTAGGLDQVHLPGADGGHDGQLYAPYTGTSGVNWGTPFATAPFDQQLVSPDEAGGLLLSNYELDIIGDDSGSGGMTRPKPKKRRKTAKALREEAQAHFKTQQLQSAEQAAGSLVLDDDVAIGQDVGGADELGGSGHEQISYEPGGGTVDDDGNGSYQESSEFGALHQGMDGTEDEPLYVNPKQYNRILKRREVRARMEEKRRRTEEAIRTGKLDVNRFVGSKDAARVNLDDADEKKVCGASLLAVELFEDYH